jgi:hypothetical protein
VKRHAKASSDGSIQGRGRLLTFSFAAALLALALLASSALASKQVLRDFGNATGSGSSGGELNNPRDVAVNETGAGPANAGDTYVADEANNRIERFDSAGNFVSAWGKNTIGPVDERQSIVIKASAGEYTLSFEGSTTEAIPLGVGSEWIREELGFLSSVGGEENVSVAGRGTESEPFVVTFQGTLAGTDLPQITADTSNLSGTIEIATIANGAPVFDDTGEGFEICTIAAECHAGIASGENGALNQPQSVAVDQDTGNVYVSDRGNRRIDEYDGEGNFIRAFGFDVAESGPGDTGTEHEVCNEEEGDTCKSGEAGSGAGQYGEGSAARGFGIAVSPADSNASSGTVYLADSGNRRIDTFDLDGTNPASFGSSANFGEEQPRSVAVDSRGIVYASDSNNGGDIQRYDSQNADGGGVGFLAPIVPPANERQELTFTSFKTGDNFTLTCPNGSPTGELTFVAGKKGSEIIETGLEEACGDTSKKVSDFSLEGEPPNVTVTFQGTLGGADQPQMTCTALGGAGSCSVTTVSQGNAGPLLSAGNASSASLGLAVNPAGNTLYVLRVPVKGSIVVQQIGPAHEPGLSAPPTVADDAHGAAANFDAEFSNVVRGFGFDNAGGRLYVSVNGDPDGSNGFENRPNPLPKAHRVYVLDDASSLNDPIAGTPSVSDTATRSATFHDEVDPEGGLVGCTFQYSTDGTKWTDVNAPDCAVFSQHGLQAISQTVSGLVPDTNYFVRLQVTRPYFSDFTPVNSAVQEFTTASGPPLVSAAKASAIDDRSVRVSAMIDPSHSPTTYVVEYGTSPALGSSTEPVEVEAGTKPAEVSPVVGGLAPATQYYFKLIATSVVGSAESDVLTATTYPAPPSFGSCPNERFRTGPSAKLPDCRAYEQVTPNDKYGSDAFGDPASVEASPSGNGITSYTFSGFPGTEAFQYANVLLSSFSGGEWSTAGLNAPPSYGDISEVIAWTPDLRLSFAKARSQAEAGVGSKLIMRDSADGSRTVLIPQSAGFGIGGGEFAVGGTFNGDSEVVFQANGAVPVTSGPAPVSTEKSNIYLYDRESGELTLAGILPDSACASPPCVPAEGSELPPAFEGYVQDGHVVTPNGDIYFTDRETGRLYLRRDGAGPGATTELVSASHKTNGTGPGGVGSNSPQPVTFQGATPDGSKALFTSNEELTNNATTGPEPFLTPVISRANSDGTGSEQSFITTRANWTAVDSGHIYWTDTEAGTIGRANIDGTNPEPSFISGLENPEGIAVDSGHIYWAEARDYAEGHGTIGRATLTGGSVEKEFITGTSDSHGVAVNSEYVYWSNNAGTTHSIGCETLVGASVAQSYISTFDDTWGIAANATDIYSVQVAQYAGIFEYTLGGEYINYGNLEEHTEARSIAIDSNYVYATDFGRGRIVRFDLSLGGYTPNFVANVNHVSGVAVDAGHIYWTTDPSPSDRPPSPGNDLYRYDRESGGLADLVPNSTDPDGAQVVGVLGYSNDASRLYFAANGDLDGAGPAESGDCVQKVNSVNIDFSGSCSLYLWQEDGMGGCATVDGCVSFVAPLDAGGGEGVTDGSNWATNFLTVELEHPKTSRVSTDGGILVFRSQLELTGYESEGTPEYYRYEAESGRITCITCNPTGAPPNGIPDLKNADLYHAISGHPISDFQINQSRNLSPNGDRFFFQSTDKLVPADVNGEAKCSSTEMQKLGSGPSCRDVYEWEAPGTPGGSCTTNSGAYSPADDGCIYLLSTGTGIYPSYLADVSESGDTVFIFSRQKLVPSDEDAQEDIYAVKVDGGLLSQNTPRPANCEGDACRGASSQPSSAPGAGSGVFEGPGNPKQGANKTQCPKGKRTVHAKGKVRCVAKKHKKAHKHKSTHKRAANTNRRASR